jgi:hypothetical protein
MAGQKYRTEGLVEAVYCTAHRTNGTPCKRRPIKGGTVCASHGGRAPQVKEAARRRIEAASDRAAAAIVRLMEDPETPHAVKLAAARDLLDRNDLTGKTAVEVTVKPWEAMLEDILITPDMGEPDALDGVVVEAEETAPAERSAVPSTSPSPLDLPALVRPAERPTASTDSRPPRYLDPDGHGSARSGGSVGADFE